MNNNYGFPEEFIGGKRNDKLTIDQNHMLTAIASSSMSDDPSTQVGACIISCDGRLISVGHNHEPRGWDSDSFPWGNDVEKIGIENTKYPYVIHAELSAILNVQGNIGDLKNATLFVTLFPCSNCAKHIAEVGIKKVVYLHEREENTDKIQTKRIFESCGIECISFSSIISDVENIKFDLTRNEKETIKIRRKTK